MQAQQQIQDQRYDPCDFEGVYDLYLSAYGSEEVASKAATKAAENLVRMRTEK